MFFRSYFRGGGRILLKSYAFYQSTSGKASWQNSFSQLKQKVGWFSEFMGNEYEFYSNLERFLLGSRAVPFFVAL